MSILMATREFRCDNNINANRKKIYLCHWFVCLLIFHLIHYNLLAYWTTNSLIKYINTRNGNSYNLRQMVIHKFATRSSDTTKIWFQVFFQLYVFKGGVQLAIQHGSMGISMLNSFSLGTFFSIMAKHKKLGFYFFER